tara:strand:+ start:409 stop:567 length:159 start_codon:yes stop_codon:yes gene_type:complete
MIPGSANAMYEILIGSFCLVTLVCFVIAFPTITALIQDNKEEEERKNKYPRE